MDNLFDLQGKQVVVTGGRVGIGRAIVFGLLEQGARVVIVSRSKNASALKKLAQNTYGSDIGYLVCDLSQPKSRKNLGSRIMDRFGRIDILINNAGDQKQAPFLDYSLSQWEYDMELLLSSVFDLSQQISKIMVRQGAGGRIINIASISSFQGAKNIVGYVTAKHGLIGLTKSMSVELAQHNINVNCIAPGFIDTDLLRRARYDMKTIKSRIPKHEIGEPKDILGTVLYLCSEASRYVTGVTIPVDGGWLAR